MCDSWVVSEETRYINEEIDYDEQVFRVGIVAKYKIWLQLSSSAHNIGATTRTCCFLFICLLLFLSIIHYHGDDVIVCFFLFK